jgi:hypothetical protein
MSKLVIAIAIICLIFIIWWYKTEHFATFDTDNNFSTTYKDLILQDENAQTLSFIHRDTQKAYVNALAEYKDVYSKIKPMSADTTYDSVNHFIICSTPIAAKNSDGTVTCTANDTTDNYCSIGEYWNNGTCSTCPAGSFCPGDGTKTGCPAGTYSTITGASSSTVCLPCPAGSYSSSGDASCSLCPAGTYSTTARSALCSKCQPGTYSSTTGATSASTCTACPYGTFASQSGSTLCADCSGKSYAKEGSSSCTFGCDPDRTETGQFQTEDCRCTNKYYKKDYTTDKRFQCYAIPEHADKTGPNTFVCNNKWYGEKCDIHDCEYGTEYTTDYVCNPTSLTYTSIRKGDIDPVNGGLPCTLPTTIINPCINNKQVVTRLKDVTTFTMITHNIPLDAIKMQLILIGGGAPAVRQGNGSIYFINGAAGAVNTINIDLLKANGERKITSFNITDIGKGGGGGSNSSKPEGPVGGFVNLKGNTLDLSGDYDNIYFNISYNKNAYGTNTSISVGNKYYYAYPSGVNGPTSILNAPQKNGVVQVYDSKINKTGYLNFGTGGIVTSKPSYTDSTDGAVIIKYTYGNDTDDNLMRTYGYVDKTFTKDTVNYPYPAGTKYIAFAASGGGGGGWYGGYSTSGGGIYAEALSFIATENPKDNIPGIGGCAAPTYMATGKKDGTVKFPDNTGSYLTVNQLSTTKTLNIVIGKGGIGGKITSGVKLPAGSTDATPPTDGKNTYIRFGGTNMGEACYAIPGGKAATTQRICPSDKTLPTPDNKTLTNLTITVNNILYQNVCQAPGAPSTSRYPIVDDVVKAGQAYYSTGGMIPAFIGSDGGACRYNDSIIQLDDGPVGTIFGDIKYPVGWVDSWDVDNSYIDYYSTPSPGCGGRGGSIEFGSTPYKNNIFTYANQPTNVGKAGRDGGNGGDGFVRVIFMKELPM